MRTLIALAIAGVAVVLARPDSPVHASPGARLLDRFQIQFDLSIIEPGPDGSTKFGLKDLESGDPIGHVFVTGLWMKGMDCEDMTFAERWLYVLDGRGSLAVHRATGPLSFCDGQWMSVAEGTVTEATGEFEADADPPYFTRIRMDATFTDSVSECICTFSFYGPASD